MVVVRSGIYFDGNSIRIYRVCLRVTFQDILINIIHPSTFLVLSFLRFFFYFFLYCVFFFLFTLSYTYTGDGFWSCPSMRSNFDIWPCECLCGCWFVFSRVIVWRMGVRKWRNCGYSEVNWNCAMLTIHLFCQLIFPSVDLLIVPFAGGNPKVYFAMIKSSDWIDYINAGCLRGHIDHISHSEVILLNGNLPVTFNFHHTSFLLHFLLISQNEVSGAAISEVNGKWNKSPKRSTK